MPHYRLTRPGLYKHNCVGRRDVSARQGHYYDAESIEELIVEARLDFPDDVAFDVQLVNDEAGTAAAAQRYTID